MSLNETCNKVRSVQSDVHPINFSLKQEDVSALFRFKCVLMYAITEVQTNQKVSKLNETLRRLFYGNDADLLGEKHTFCLGNERSAFLVASKEAI